MADQTVGTVVKESPTKVEWMTVLYEDIDFETV